MLNKLFKQLSCSFAESRRRSQASLFLVAALVLLPACESESGMVDDQPPPVSETECMVTDQPVLNACELPDNQIVSGGPPKDGIPALTNPPLVTAEQVTYLGETDRVIGLILDGEPVAVPHNILWWHEIMNFDGVMDKIAITYCPLTDSSIVFDRTAIGGAELGVSGLLYQNNLIMYDRNETEALWSQMLTGARCNSAKGVTLSTVHHVEMTWAGWKALHPDTQVISNSTGFARNYQQYPYGDYEVEDNSRILFPMDNIDCRRPPKERVLGIPGTNGTAITFPFGLLAEEGAKAVVQTDFEGQPVMVLWDGESQSAVAFRPETEDGVSVRISVVNDEFVDQLTNTVFSVGGAGIDGQLTGRSLRAIDEAYVAFWFAWPAFHPHTMIF